MEQARVEIASFHADSPWTDYARQVLTLPDHSHLRKLEGEYQEAKGGLAFAVANLQKAQQQRAEQQDLSTQQAELWARIRAIDKKLATLGIVRSPYPGIIKSIKWLAQKDQELQLELVLELNKDLRSAASYWVSLAENSADS
ncbi:MAG: hypothetical protein ACFCU8_07090 [Thermosynechococcaceae cyanobacterium]